MAGVGLLSAAGGLILFGLTALIQPEFVVRLGATLSGPDAVAEVRATYGGLSLGLAAPLIYAALQRKSSRVALLGAALLYFGYGAGKSIGFAVEGLSFSLFALGFKLLTLATALMLFLIVLRLPGQTRPSPLASRFLDGTVWFNGAVFFALGWLGLFYPQALAAMGYEVTSAGAVAELRAVYGGFCLSVGVVVVLFYYHGDQYLGLLACLGVNAGLALGRLIGLVLDCCFSATTYAVFAYEIVLSAVALLAVWFYRRLQAATAART